MNIKVKLLIGFVCIVWSLIVIFAIIADIPEVENERVNVDYHRVEVKPSVEKIEIKPSVKPSVKSVVKPSVKKLSISQENAIRAAKNYINTMPFSRKSLVKQLEYEGYTNKESVYAVDSLKIDYNKQAEKAAKGYIDTMPFSRKSLIKQLEFEGYTNKQSVYGVTKAGL